MCSLHSTGGRYVQIHTTIEYYSPDPCVIALGCFDGVHRGHAEVIKTAKKAAQIRHLPLCVFTFAAPPRNYFIPRSVPLITDTAEKLSILEDIGVDRALCLPLSHEIFSITPEDFIDKILAGRLRAVHVVCGFNYTFGAKGVGNTELLKQRCETLGIGVTVVPEFTMDGVAISSSLVREAVKNGDMETAKKYLGRSFFLRSTVVNGQHLARTLGFPTVNTVPDPKLLLPKNGVYATRISFDGIQKFGITNVGVRPTVNTGITCAETHIFDFCGDLYGKEITVEFLHFLRPERKFPSVEIMAEQIRADIETAKEILSLNDM